jgi:hypothetical protein
LTIALKQDQPRVWRRLGPWFGYEAAVLYIYSLRESGKLCR